MSIDIKIYKELLKNKNSCQKDIANKIKMSETSVSRRLQKLSNFKFIKMEKVDKMNKHVFSIKPEYQTKIKNLIELFDKGTKF